MRDPGVRRLPRPSEPKSILLSPRKDRSVQSSSQLPIGTLHKRGGLSQGTSAEIRSGWRLLAGRKPGELSVAGAERAQIRGYTREIVC
jgi:hypothetical protein